MTCDRCKGSMIEHTYFGVVSFLCIKCGNVVYPAYPKRKAYGNTCELCGDDFIKRHRESTLCLSCRKLSRPIIRKLGTERFERALPWSDKKEMEVYL